jgi:hypothetical protein
VGLENVDVVVDVVVVDVVVEVVVDVVVADYTDEGFENIAVDYFDGGFENEVGYAFLSHEKLLDHKNADPERPVDRMNARRSPFVGESYYYNYCNRDSL